MRLLYHHTACPFSRQARVLLKELQLDFIMKKIDYWLNPAELLKINPSGELPILIEQQVTVVGIYTIIEYLNEQYDLKLMPKEILIRCEIRRLLYWFNKKLYFDVVKYFIEEKLIKLLTNTGSPQTEKIMLAKINLEYHLNYINQTLEQYGFLGYDKVTVSDIAAASQLSILDYFGEIIWERYPIIKNWYCIIKSRPSFYNILQDRLAGFYPPSYYIELDF